MKGAQDCRTENQTVKELYRTADEEDVMGITHAHDVKNLKEKAPKPN